MDSIVVDNFKLGEINESLSVIGKCKNLLNPTFKTTTSNGITCINNNGDGTYTVNGTATADVLLEILPWRSITPGIYRVVGCPSGGSRSKYLIEINTPSSDGSNKFNYDIGDGVDLTVSKQNSESSDNIVIRIVIKSGCVCNNLVFKPMLTTNYATYDDFVPYTGEGETLTADVAELKNDLAKLFSSNITGIKLNGSTLEVSFNNGTSVGKVSFEGISEEETIIS